MVRKGKKKGVRTGIVRLEERTEEAIKSDKKSKSGCLIPAILIAAGIAGLSLLYSALRSSDAEYTNHSLDPTVSAPAERSPLEEHAVDFREGVNESHFRHSPGNQESIVPSFHGEIVPERKYFLFR